MERLIENVSVTLKNSKLLPIKEEVVEVEGTARKCIAAYEVSISRYDYLNENGRIYSKRLWENVINNQKHIWEGSFGLMDHPEKSGSVKDRFCVWGDMRLDEASQTVKATMYLFGKHGQDIHDGIQAGGNQGLSSSGFGEMMEDGKNVNPDTFQIERPSDAVLDPSQKVYAVKTDEINVNEDIVTDKEVNIQETQKKSATNNKEDIKKVDVKENTMSEKLISHEDKIIKRNIRSSLKEAISIENPSERLKELAEVQSYFEDFNDVSVAKDLHEDVASALVEAKNQIEELASKGEKFEGLKEENDKAVKSLQEAQESISKLQESIKEKDALIEELSKKFEISIQEMDSSKKIYANLKEMYESKSEDSKKLEVAIQEMDKMKEAYKQKEELFEKACEELDIIKAEFLGEAKKKKEAEGDDSEDEPKEEKKKKESISFSKKHPNLKIESTHEVEAYYNKLLESNEKIAELKDQFAECKTYREAVKLYLDNKAWLQEERVPQVDNRRLLPEEREVLNEKKYVKTEIDDNRLFENFEL